MTVNTLPLVELAKMADRAESGVAHYTRIAGEPLVKEMSAEPAKVRGKK